MTLLDAAKALGVRQTGRRINIEDIELSVSLLKNEITLSQAAQAWGLKNVTTGYARMLRAIQEGYRAGMVSITFAETPETAISAKLAGTDNGHAPDSLE